MVGVFALSVVDHGLESRSGQTKGYEIYLPHRGVMVNVFALSVVHHGLESRSGQTKGYEIYLPHRWCNG